MPYALNHFFCEDGAYTLYVLFAQLSDFSLLQSTPSFHPQIEEILLLSTPFFFFVHVPMNYD